MVRTTDPRHRRAGAGGTDATAGDRPMPRMARMRQREETRDKLLEAARATFASQGLAATTVAQISEAAGYTTGAFYSNFPSKDAMAREIASHDIESGLDLAAGLADQGVTAARVALTSAIDEGTVNLDRNRLHLELLLHGTRDEALGQIARTRIAAGRQQIGGILEQVFTALGRRPAVAPAELASLILALSYGTKVLSLAGDPVAPGPLVDAVLSAMIDSAMPAAGDA